MAETVGGLLKRVREGRGESQAAAGHALGWDQSKVSRVERNAQELDVDDLLALLAYLDVPVPVLIDSVKEGLILAVTRELASIEHELRARLEP